MGPWLDSVTGWLAANPQWLAVAVFIVALVECLAIAGLIVPGTVLLFAVAVLAGSGALSLSETLLLAGLKIRVSTSIATTAAVNTHQARTKLPVSSRSHPVIHGDSALTRKPTPWTKPASCAASRGLWQ